MLRTVFVTKYRLKCKTIYPIFTNTVPQKNYSFDKIIPTSNISKFRKYWLKARFHQKLISFQLMPMRGVPYANIIPHSVKEELQFISKDPFCMFSCFVPYEIIFQHLSTNSNGILHSEKEELQFLSNNLFCIFSFFVSYNIVFQQSTTQLNGITF